MVQRVRDFVGARENAEIVEPLLEPDAGCPGALGAPREQIFADFLFQRVPVLDIKNPQHCTRGD